MRRYIIYICVAIAGLSLQSCLHDNKDLFDQTAAERIDAAVADAKQMLVSASNGWRMEYYLGSDYKYGGYNMFVEFGSDGKAHLSSEIAESDKKSTSAWDVTKDQGPVLTFNTYNELLHELTQPYSENVDGYEGDYEFIIMEVKPDTVRLQGKKWGNEILLIRNGDDVDWIDYLDKVKSVRKNFIYLYKTTIDGRNITFDMDTDKQVVVNSVDENGEIIDELATAQFIFTPTGIKLREPLTIGNVTIESLDYDNDETDVKQSKLVSPDGDCVLDSNVPATFQLFEDLGGQYRLSYNTSKSVVITLEPEETWDGKQFKLKGLVRNEKKEDVDLVAEYDPVMGRVKIPFQYVGMSDKTKWYTYLCMWALDDGGSITFNDASGVYLVWNGDTSNPVYTFTSTNSFAADSFILFAISQDGEDSDGSDFIFVSESDYRLPYLTNLTKL